MINDQLKFIKKFRKDLIVQVDSTHNLTKQGFKLTTIHLKDENHEGIPIAFMFSNRKDKETIKFFFSGLKRVLGKRLNAKVFMSDDYSVYYNAWCDVMYEDVVDKSSIKYPIKLLCSWHVIRSIRKKIKKYVKNTLDMNYQNKVMMQFINLRNETNEIKFKNLLNQFLDFIKQFPEFDDYFQKYYLNRVQEWAYCYRIYLKINVNMSVENYHLILKKYYFKMKKTFRLDKSIFLILKHLNKRFRSRDHEIIIGRKTTKRTTKCFANHKQAKLNITNYQFEVNDSFVVKEKNMNEKIKKSNKTEFKDYKSKENEDDLKIASDDNNNDSLINDEEEYLVCIQRNSCQTKPCPLTCQFCSVCICEVFCTCKDFSIDYSFCIHCHLVLINERVKNNDFNNNLNKEKDLECNSDATISDDECMSTLSDEIEPILDNQYEKTVTKVTEFVDPLFINELTNSLDEIKLDLENQNSRINDLKYSNIRRCINQFKTAVRTDINTHLPKFVNSPSKRQKMDQQKRY